MNFDEYTRAELIDRLSGMSTANIVDYLIGRGLKLKPELPDLPPGVYRRKNGGDIIYINRSGQAHGISLASEPHPGDKTIVWTLGGSTDRWIHIVDEDRQPILNGIIAEFDRLGKRVG